MTNVDNIDELFRRLSNTLTRPNPYVIRERDEETGAIREVEYDTARFGDNYVTDAHTNPFPLRPGAPRYGVWRAPPQGQDIHGNRPYLLVTCSVEARDEYRRKWTGPLGIPISRFSSIEIVYDNQNSESTTYIISKQKVAVEKESVTVSIQLPHCNADNTLTYDEVGLKNVESIVSDWVIETPSNIRAMGIAASDDCLFQCLTALHVRIGDLEAAQTDGWRNNVEYRFFRDGDEHSTDKYEIHYPRRIYASAAEWWDTVVYRPILDDVGRSAIPRSLTFGERGVAAQTRFAPFEQLNDANKYAFNNGFFPHDDAFRSPLVINVYFHR